MRKQEVIQFPFNKVYRSKGVTLFIVYVYKLNPLKNKKHLFTCITVLFLTHPSCKQILCFDFEKLNSVRYLVIFYVLCFRISSRDSEKVKRGGRFVEARFRNQLVNTKKRWRG